uniref:Uncharacterized protein n=1 Tax=Moniliophthora roreri TaxID=221103 RepID=A0A0W0GER2_MONRR
MPSATVTLYFLPDNVDFALLLQHTFENKKDDLGTTSNAFSPLSSVPSSSEFGPVPTSEAMSPIRLEDLGSTDNAEPSKALEASILHALENGFSGHHAQYGNTKYTLEDITGSEFNFTKVDWNGQSDFVIVMWDGFEIIHGKGFTDQMTWHGAMVRVANKLDSERKNMSFTGRLLKNCHGGFFALSAGVSCNLGLKKPKVVGQANKKNTESAAFYHCQPVLCHYIYAHITFNFGPQTVCAEHTDFGNRADGSCAITALSPSVSGYNYKNGGHLILWDLRLVIKFLPGATILILSAVLCHSNIAIGDKERCYRLETIFWASLKEDEVTVEKEKDKARWKSSFTNFAKFH